MTDLTLTEMETFIDKLHPNLDAKFIKLVENGIYFEVRPLPCDPLQLHLIFEHPTTEEIQVTNIEGYQRSWLNTKDLQEWNLEND